MKKKLVIVIVIAIIFGCNSKQTVHSEKRYVVTSPEVAEIICLFEGAENIVGITSECDYPVYLQQKQIIGNFGKIDFEKILNLNPSLVFTAGLEQDALAEELKKLDISTEKIHSHSISEMLDSIVRIGNLIEKETRAEFVVDSLKTEIASIPKLKKNPKVYIEIYGDPIMSVSDSSFVGQLINLAGGKNIFPTLPRDYSRINPEKVIEANPEIIILTYPGMTAENIKNRKGWQVLDAVKSNRIYDINQIDPNLILRASPRMINGVKEIQKVFNEEK
ncbi:MAG: helical backbone metal receptor [Candidatus Cloacimonetes bacterium]|nr:helical backbone metal receptor [Candidatus Cloacimonadota bacterium]MCF7812952.1 helical backbone metal receptor [Candidatus Cloacimonadota bacterium]MCF7867163.1 helical backbone metal receptor [Candidatus Cloacimonadota bacterium]MCF7882517.1 helical backbone metal receptor [Candidatus Cloacimonadota bacterium]